MREIYLTVKRIADVLVAGILLIFLSPIILLSLLIQWLEIGSSPVFFQERPGKGEKVFRIIKLKTMNEKRDENGVLLPDRYRITKFGRFFRSASIDELPQLINVLKGDMSFVGPRPLLVAYLPLYNQHQKKRHNVRPGITGLAQVSGRNAISWEEKFDHDVHYVENLSLHLDLKILLLTVYKVVRRKDIQNQDSVPMPRFTGSPKGNVS